MKLSNRFKDIDKQRIWLDHQYCAITGLNEMCSLHHIYGTLSDSIFNSIMLTHDEHKKADGENTAETGNKRRQRYLNYTFNLIKKNSNYQIQDKDRKFLEWVFEDFTLDNKTIAKSII